MKPNKLLQNSTLALLCLFAALIPFGFNISNYILALYMLTLVINKDLYKNICFKEIDKEEKIFIIFSGLYVVLEFVSLIWSDDFSLGLDLAARIVPIILFPLAVIFAHQTKIIKNYNFVIYSFLLGMFISSVVCLYLSYQNCWQETENGIVFDTTILSYNWHPKDAWESISDGYNNFSYQNLSHFIHPSYYSLYFVFCIIIVLFSINKGKSITYKILSVLSIIYSLGFIFLLQTRANTISIIAATLALLIVYVYYKRNWLVFIIAICCLAVGATLIIQNSRARYIFSGLNQAFHSQTKEEFKVEVTEHINTRVVIWINTLHIIKENPILGVGIGDINQKLEAEYKKNNIEFDFGTHNQYLYAWVTAGILGLIALLGIVLTPLIYGIKYKNFKSFAFTIAVAVNLFFENMLYRNAGLLFIPLMMAILILSKQKSIEKNN